MINNSDAALVIFDITDEESFKDAEMFILEFAKTKFLQKNDSDFENLSEKEKLNFIANLPIVLVGNKVDLEDERVVSKSQVQEILMKYKCKFFEVSAKSDHNVTPLFHYTFQYYISGKYVEENN